MKKIDKLILVSFLKLFGLTFCVAFFVLLMQFFLLHFDALIGKGLGLTVYMQLTSYVGIVSTKQAFPLAILLSSIMTLGNLGEHHELTALKSAGISLTRVLWPLSGFVLLLSIGVLLSNGYAVPRANLDAVSLLYDLGKKKPSVAIKEGIFYDGIPGYSIKVRKKLDDQTTLQGIMIYDHTQCKGNISLTIAESGKIYTVYDEAYMAIELFNGHNYIEELPHNNPIEGHHGQSGQFYRSSFKTQKLLISLESLKLARTKQELFAHSCRAKNAKKLANDVADMKKSIQNVQHSLRTEALGSFLQVKSTKRADATAVQSALLEKANILHFKAYAEQHQNHQKKTSLGHPSLPYTVADCIQIHREALKSANSFRDKLDLQAIEIRKLKKEIRKHNLEWHKMMAWAVSCIVVFLVGAPLGAIIKKGGLGVPLIIATGLIVWHYIFAMLGEKWANEGVIDTFSGAWLANWLLLPFGLFFLRQAYKDARLLEAEFYILLFMKSKRYVRRMCKLDRPLRNQ